MKFLRKFLPAATTLALAGGVFFGFSGVANAACQFQYTATNFQTSTTPVFNSICGVPTQFNSTQGAYAWGDETDFVRIRPNTSGDDTSNKNNPKLVGGTLTSACDSGSKYDILTYIHNDASQDFNNNGSGSAVAHNVQLAMDAAGIGTTNDQFTFTNTVSASNAASVSDSATLDCNGHQVKLTLVPGTVHYNNNFDFSTTWGNAPDSAVNGTTTLGSPTWGSGDQWGCWNYLTAVVYQVTVTAVPPTSTLECLVNSNDIIVDQQQRKVSLTISPRVTNATVAGYSIDWGDGTLSSKQSDSHTYASSTVAATIVASFTAKLADGTTQTVSGSGCEFQVSFKPNTPPVTPPPTTLVNTGAGNVIGLFAAVSAAGAVAYRWLLARRLSRD